MLTLSGADLPSTPATFIGGAIALSTTRTGGGATFSYGLPSNTSLSATTATPIAIDGEVITIAAPTNAGAIETITLGGQVYQSAADGTPGTFIWDVATQQIIVFPLGVTPAAGTVAIVGYSLDAYADTQPTMEVLEAPPDWFQDWNITGSFRYSRSFEDQPSGGFSFITPASNESDVRSRLKNGTKITAFGIGFSVDSISVSRLPIATYPDRWIQVEVSLTGRYVIELDNVVKVRKAIDQDGGTLSSLAQLAGIPYSGPATILNQSVNTPYSVGVTFGEELSSRAISSNGFAFYSASNNVQIREWASTRLHTLSTADLLSPVEISLGGKYADYFAQNQNNQLSHEYRNTRLELDTDANAADRIRNTLIWIEDADEAYATAPPEFTSSLSDQLSLANLSHNFDNGGVTKERTRTLYKNGTVLKMERYKYGFTFKGSQVYEYSVSGGSATTDVTIDWYRYTGAGVVPNAFWGLVESTYETYTYEQNEGYLTKVEIDGWRLSRLKQEQDAAETIKAQYAPTISLAGRVVYDGNILRQAYNWIRLVQIDVTRYRLASFLGLYPDIQRPKDDLTWIEPRYALVTRRTVSQTDILPNPDVNKPALTTGKSYTEVKRIVVNYPDAGISRSKWQQEFEQYTTHTKTSGNQGESLKDALNIGRRTENLGRPSTHTRIEIVKNRIPIGTAAQPEPQTSQRALLNSPNNGIQPDDPEQGSVQFPGIFDYESGRQAARTALSIANTRDTEVWRVTVRHKSGRQIAEGDRVHLLGKIFVVFSVDEEIGIQGTLGDRSILTSGGVSLTLGLYLNPPITLSFNE